LKVIVEASQDGKLLVRIASRIVPTILSREDRVEEFNLFAAWT
jgi:hypothetical protein